ncbi:MAG: translesion error-prone DNA polymerase V autoproteolytic subunit [Acidobacteria bacterium]|nr:translesion error-prone DNA polymerase V autoproteolytic subunit [Acidobacteriota bacterium]MBI3424774.1 translesion error-prone DNA polymerase V autoproteolytic subunit [Acidobacteriota bacterium]
MSADPAIAFQTQDSVIQAAFSPALPPVAALQPLEQSPVKVGFASPAESTTQARLNLNDHLLRHPLATFFVKVRGDAMSGAKLFDDALLVIDRAEPAQHGHLVLAVVNGEFCVRRLEISNNRIRLCAAHPGYADIELTAEDQWEIWGRVIYSINQH